MEGGRGRRARGGGPAATRRGGAWLPEQRGAAPACQPIHLHRKSSNQDEGPTFEHYVPGEGDRDRDLGPKRAHSNGRLQTFMQGDVAMSMRGSALL